MRYSLNCNKYLEHGAIRKYENKQRTAEKDFNLNIELLQHSHQTIYLFNTHTFVSFYRFANLTFIYMHIMVNVNNICIPQILLIYLYFHLERQVEQLSHATNHIETRELFLKHSTELKFESYY